MVQYIYNALHCNPYMYKPASKGPDPGVGRARDFNFF